MFARWSVGWLLVGLAACGSRAVEAVQVARLDEGLERSGDWRAGCTSRPGVGVEPMADGSGAWFVYDIEAADWRTLKNGWLGLEVPEGYAQGDFELRIGAQRARVSLLPGELRLKRAEVPSAAELRIFTARDQPGIHGGALVPLWPGEELAWTLDVSAEQELSFQSLTLGVRGAELEGELSLVVTLDAEEPSVLSVPANRAGGLIHQRVPLREGAGRRLTLRTSGAAVPLWLVSPRLAPRERGTPRARPWPEARPDILVILADTFRADLLAAYGGSGATTPALDRLAERSRRFLAARSTSTWTLPAQASLFTGLWPAQHAAEKPSQALDPALATLAETLRAAGYRTGAVTDGGYVTRAHGFARGFEWFREVEVRSGARLADSLAAADAFLAADDGRPTFLFVHTYRVHSPYRRDEERISTEYSALRRRLFEAQERGEPREELVHALRGLYEEGARALDRELGAWCARLEQEGRFERGLLVFTSDHGEAFLEHGEVFHAHAPHEEELRIPLLLFGAGIEPGDVREGVSLVDLFPTLARRAGARLPPGLPGRDLSLAGDERLLFASVHHRGGHHLAAIAGAEKLIAHHPEQADFAQGERRLFDLVRDPGERLDLLEQPGHAPFVARAVAAYAEAARPVGQARSVEFTPDQLEALRALGYGD